MKGVLGNRLAVPPNPDVGWVVKMSNRIRDLGLTSENCAAIARVLEGRRGIHSFERTIWDADKLLAESELKQEERGPGGNTPTRLEDI